MGELTVLVALTEGFSRRGQPHRVRSPLVLVGQRAAQAEVFVARSVLRVAGVGHLAHDDRRGEVVGVVVDRRAPAPALAVLESGRSFIEGKLRAKLPAGKGYSLSLNLWTLDAMPASTYRDLAEWTFEVSGDPLDI